MDSDNQKINILIVGATGNLGALVTKHCLTQPNLLVNILGRDPQKNKELTAAVENAGGRVIQGDITKPGTLKGVTKGMHTVIFTLPPFGPNVVVDGQIALINDAVENGVQRVVPSEFRENWDKLSPEEIAPLIPLVNKLQVREHLKTLPIKALFVNTGLFIESFFEYLVVKDFGYWGDVDHVLDLTSYENTARVVAAAVGRKDLAGDFVYVADNMTAAEIADTYNKVRGTNIKPVRLGSTEDLQKKIEELESKGESGIGLLVMRILVFICDKRSKFDKTNNDVFPEVKRTTVEDFLRERPDVKLNYAEN